MVSTLVQIDIHAAHGGTRTWTTLVFCGAAPWRDWTPGKTGPWRGRIQPQPLLLDLCRPLYTLEMKESRVTRVSHFEACDVSFYSL